MGEISSIMSLAQERKGAVDVEVSFKLCKGVSENTNVSISLSFDNWSIDNYVLMPSAVYNGNRFDVRKIGYPPQLCDENDLGADVPTIITDVPRLNIDEERSKIQLLTGDLATPAVGFADFQSKQGFWLLTEQGTRVGDSGITVEEDAAKQTCQFRFLLRASEKISDIGFVIPTYPSEDTGIALKQGDTVKLNLRLFFFECEDVQAFLTISLKLERI